MMRMGKTESGFNSSYCAFSAGKGPLSGQNYVPSHGKVTLMKIVRNKVMPGIKVVHGCF